MHRDEFEARYRLLQTALRSGGAITHHALSPEGAVVMVHVFDGEPHAVADLERRTAAAVEAGDARILERLMVDDHPVVVTRFILDFEGLDGWLPPAPAEGSDEARTAGGGVRQDPRDEPEGPGEFTRAFDAVDLPARPASPESAESPPPAAGPESGPGEFTRMFRASDLPTDTDAPVPPAPPAPEPGEPAPGEFTRLFRAQELDPEVPGGSSPKPEGTEREGTGASGTADDADSPGEFTRQFGALSSPEPEGERPAAPPPPDDMGDFTREFGGTDGAESGSDEAAPPPPKSEPGDFTRQFGALGSPPSEPRTPVDPAVGFGEETAPRYDDDGGFDGPPEPDFGGGRSSPPVPRPDELPEPRYSRPEASPPPMADPVTPTGADDELSFSGPGDEYSDRLHALPDPGPPPPSSSPEPDTEAADSGPGEYTRIIQGIRPPEPEKKEAAPAAPPVDSGPAEEKAPSTKVFVWLLVAIGVLAVVLVVVLVLTAPIDPPDPSALPG